MDAQELIKLSVAPLAGLVCILAGIAIIFEGMRAQNGVDLTAVLKGQLTTGTTGLLLVLIGSVLIAILVIHETTLSRVTLTLPGGGKETILIGRDFKFPTDQELDRMIKRMSDAAPDMAHATPSPSP